MIVGGEPATAWLGLLVAWAAVGYGASSASRAAGLLISAGEGACGTLSETVCQVAGLGGLLMGVVALAVGTLLGIVMARGFGPPLTWWVLPISLAALALAPLTAAEGAGPPFLWLVVALAAALGSLSLATAVVRRSRAARFGWIRLDGLDAREAAHRPIDRTVIPLAALTAGVAGGAFGALVITLLSEA